MIWLASILLSKLPTKLLSDYWRYHVSCKRYSNGNVNRKWSEQSRTAAAEASSASSFEWRTEFINRNRIRFCWVGTKSLVRVVGQVSQDWRQKFPMNPDGIARHARVCDANRCGRFAKDRVWGRVIRQLNGNSSSSAAHPDFLGSPRLFIFQEFLRA